jgi:hypothetical protein
VTGRGSRAISWSSPVDVPRSSQRMVESGRGLFVIIMSSGSSHGGTVPGSPERRRVAISRLEQVRQVWVRSGDSSRRSRECEVLAGSMRDRPGQSASARAPVGPSRRAGKSVPAQVRSAGRVRPAVICLEHDGFDPPTPAAGPRFSPVTDLAQWPGHRDSLDVLQSSATRADSPRAGTVLTPWPIGVVARVQRRVPQPVQGTPRPGSVA